MSDLVLRDVTEGLCTLTLNRPEKLNALSHAIFEELSGHLDEIAAKTDTIGCVVLTGAGKSFCAGHDLDDLAQGRETMEVLRHESHTIQKLADLPIPVIAAVRGHCYTGGLELALGADLLIAARTAKFADTHAKWGLVPAWGGSQRLPARVGRAKALEMMFSARTYSGEEAQSFGLANFSVPEDDLDAAVARLARDILANAWAVHRQNKAIVTATAGMDIKAGLAYEFFVRQMSSGEESKARLAKWTK